LETPPRAWGRRRVGHGNNLCPGNTPTSVGKTPRLRHNDLALRKHPHERGEDEAWTRKTSLTQETPPRAWGRLPVPFSFLFTIGNTPTSVGKTQEAEIYQTMHRKHPHERGEDGVVIRYYHLRQETPPRAWGRPR